VLCLGYYSDPNSHFDSQHEEVEKEQVEVQWRAAEVAVRQRAMAQEASKKRVREEPEAGPVAEVQ